MTPTPLSLTEERWAALREGETVLAATFEGGFGSGKALYDRAADAFGMTPGAYRRRGEGLRIRCALFETALGIVLVAASEQGVCAVALGGEVAAAIGQPSAVRAVAQACGANALALIVPCHRVVGAGGELRGYRWGLDRKRRLLELEKDASA